MKRRARGLTLLELLVALVIFGVLAVLAYGGLGHLLDGEAQLRNEEQSWRDLSHFFLRIDDDLGHARERPVRDAGGLTLPALAGRPVDSRASGEPSLELTRGGELHYGAQPRSDLRRVGYRLRDGTLSRLAWPALDRPPGAAPAEMPLLEGVEAFELRFYAERTGWTALWPRNPDSAELAALPRAVELTVVVKGLGRFQRVFLVNR